MCGRYRIADDASSEQMQAILDALNRKGIAFKTGEIYPGDAVPVIANSRTLKPSPFVMRWGYASADGRRIINARSETAAQKSLFADGMRLRRCLVPASSYYEWMRRSREKTKYEISDALSPMLYMAGVYRLTQAGAEFSILTRQPDPSVAFLHDRMPVILPSACLSAWLDQTQNPQEILSLAAASLRAAPVPGQAETISFFDDEEP